MSSNSEPIMQQLQHDFKELLALVSGPEAFTHSAYSIESRLFRGLLALGKALLHLFFITRAAEPLRAPMLETSGKTLRYHEKRPRDYYSVFGKLTFARPYYYLKGEAGVCPLDAKLSLPKRCYSDLLREWATCGATEGSFRDSASLLQRILSLPLSLQAVETMSAEDAVDVQTFYDSKLLSSPPASPSLRCKDCLRQRMRLPYPLHRAACWWCKPMARGCLWCSRPSKVAPHDWAKEKSAARKKRLS